MKRVEEAKRWWFEYRCFIRQVKRIQSNPDTLDQERFATMMQYSDKESLHKMARKIRNELDRRRRKKDGGTVLTSVLSYSRDFGSPELIAMEREKRQKKKISNVMGVTYVEDVEESVPVFFFDEKLKIYSNEPIKNRSTGYWRVVEYREGCVQGEKHFATKKGAEEYASEYYGL